MTTTAQERPDLQAKVDEHERWQNEHMTQHSESERRDGDVSGRLDALARTVESFAATLADHRQAVEKDLADHRQAVEKDLADHRQAVEKDLADHRQAVEKDLADHRQAVEKVVDRKLSTAWRVFGVLNGMIVAVVVFALYQVNSIHGRFDAVHARIDALGGRIDVLDDSVSGRLDALGVRIDTLYDRLGELVDRVANIPGIAEIASQAQNCIPTSLIEAASIF